VLASCHCHQNLKNKHGERKLGLTFVEGRLSLEKSGLQLLYKNISNFN
jgi:hypothetical protein